MSWTKRELIDAAFEEIGLANYVFDLQSAQLQSALRKLDSMMATWNIKGIKLGYPIPSAANGSDLDDDSNLPDRANEAAYLNLALRLAPSFGKQVSQDTKRNAKEAYRAMIIHNATPLEKRLPNTMPLGAGNKPSSYGNGQFVQNLDELQIN